MKALVKEAADPGHVRLVSDWPAPTATWDRVLRMLAAGIVDPSPLATTYPLEKWERAFDDVEKRRVVKAVILPRQS